MKKHAYLIMAHHDFSLLQKLLLLLDDPHNDLYLHIDKKSDKSMFENVSLQYSNLYIIPSISVNWGGHSQIRCELNLLKSAIPNKYTYYHLLSGADLPIKSNKYIQDFFEHNAGKEFLIANKISLENNNLEILNRIKYYYFFQNTIGRNGGKLMRIFEILEVLSIQLQKCFKVDRIKNNNLEYYKGGNWFSITHNLATFLIANEDKIKHIFSKTVCADELFLQTFAMQSPYKDNIVCDNNLRCIDWQRGKPYTFRLEDFDLLMSSDKLFARKFSTTTDSNIIHKIYNSLYSKKSN